MCYQYRKSLFPLSKILKTKILLILSCLLNFPPGQIEPLILEGLNLLEDQGFTHNCFHWNNRVMTPSSAIPLSQLRISYILKRNNFLLELEVEKIKHSSDPDQSIEFWIRHKITQMSLFNP